MMEVQRAPGAAVDPDTLLVVPRLCLRPGCPTPTRFLTEKDWYTHILRHALEAPVEGKKYGCPVDGCSKVYTQKANLEGHVNDHCWIKKYVCLLCKVAFKKMPDRSKHKCIAKELAQGTANTTGRTRGQGKGPKKGEAKGKGKRIHQSATAKSIRIREPTVAASNPVAESALPHIENYTFAEDVQAEATPQAYALDTPGSTPSATACSSADTTAVNTPSDYNVACSAYSSSKFAPGAVPEVSLPYSATNSAFSTPLRLQDSNDMDTGNVETERDDTEKPVFDYLPLYAAGDDAFFPLGNPDSYIDNMDIDNDPVVSADANVSAPVVVDNDPAFGRLQAELIASNAVNNDVQHGAENVAYQSMIMPEMNTADDNTQHDGPQHIVENATNNAVFALSATHGSLAQDGQAMVDLLPHAAPVHDLDAAPEEYFDYDLYEALTAAEIKPDILDTHMPRPLLWRMPPIMIPEGYPVRPSHPLPPLHQYSWFTLPQFLDPRISLPLPI